MLVVILLYDQLLFRPLVAWSAKFRFETTAGATAADPWMLRLMRRTRLLSRLGDAFGARLAAIGGMRLALPLRRRRQRRDGRPRALVDALWLAVLAGRRWPGRCGRSSALHRRRTQPGATCRHVALLGLLSRCSAWWC